MTGSGGYLSMDTTATSQGIAGIDESILDAGSSLVAQAANGSTSCGQAIPGCQQLAAANANATARINQFLAQSKQTIQALKAAGAQSVPDYQQHEENARQGIARAGAQSPFAGH